MHFLKPTANCLSRSLYSSSSGVISLMLTHRHTHTDTQTHTHTHTHTHKAREEENKTDTKGCAACVTSLTQTALPAHQTTIVL